MKVKRVSWRQKLKEALSKRCISVGRDSLRWSLRAAVVTAIGCLFIFIPPLSKLTGGAGYWVPISSVMVLETTTGACVRKSIYRFLGTLVAGILGFVGFSLLTLHGQLIDEPYIPYATATLAVALTAFWGLLRGTSANVSLVGAVATHVVVFGAYMKGDVFVGIKRIVCVLIGIIIGTIVSVVVMPVGATPKLLSSTANVLRALSSILKPMFEHEVGFPLTRQSPNGVSLGDTSQSKPFVNIEIQQVQQNQVQAKKENEPGDKNLKQDRRDSSATASTGCSDILTELEGMLRKCSMNLQTLSELVAAARKEPTLSFSAFCIPNFRNFPTAMYDEVLQHVSCMFYMASSFFATVQFNVKRSKQRKNIGLQEDSANAQFGKQRDEKHVSSYLTVDRELFDTTCLTDSGELPNAGKNVAIAEKTSGECLGPNYFCNQLFTDAENAESKKLDTAIGNNQFPEDQIQLGDHNTTSDPFGLSTFVSPYGRDSKVLDSQRNSLYASAIVETAQCEYAASEFSSVCGISCNSPQRNTGNAIRGALPNEDGRRSMTSHEFCNLHCYPGATTMMMECGDDTSPISTVERCDKIWPVCENPRNSDNKIISAIGAIDGRGGLGDKSASYADVSVWIRTAMNNSLQARYSVLLSNAVMQSSTALLCMADCLDSDVLSERLEKVFQAQTAIDSSNDAVKKYAKARRARRRLAGKLMEESVEAEGQGKFLHGSKQRLDEWAEILGDSTSLWELDPTEWQIFWVQYWERVDRLSVTCMRLTTFNCQLYLCLAVLRCFCDRIE